MFPRPYFSGRHFAPLYFPSAAVTEVHLICAGVSIYARIDGTVEVTPRIEGTPDLVEC